MRIEELLLERYGVFQDRRLDFSGAGPHLHVIHGPNEAGKSTILSAIVELLFGFDERTSYAFPFKNYDPLCLGATLTNRAGASLAFKRRKKRRSLFDPQGLPLPDNALSPFLGGIDRDGFRLKFGLSYERLRKGGDQMLAAKGDLTSILFEAGSGLPTVIPALEKLKEEAEELFSPQRYNKNKPLYQALDALDAARASMRKDSLKTEQWTEAMKAEATARQELADLADRLNTLRRRHSRVQRLTAVRPILARLDDLSNQRSVLGEGPPLPATFADRWRDAVNEQHLAAAEPDRLRTLHDALERQLASLPDPGPLPTHGTRIEQLFQDSGRIDALRAAQPKIQRDLEHSDRNLAALVAELGQATARPSQPLVARIRDAMTRRAALDVALPQAVERQEAARQSLTELDAALTALGTPPNPAAAAAAFAEAQAVGAVETRLAETDQALRQAEKLTELALSRLGLWRGTIAALVSTPFPTAEQIRRFDQEFLAISGTGRQNQEAIEHINADRRQTEAELRALEEDGGVPTAEALRQVRQQRDRLWELFRLTYVDGHPAEEDLSAPDKRPEAFTALLHQADDLADRREREASRVNRHRALTAKRGELAEETRRQETLSAALERRHQACETQWRSLWADSGIAVEDPATMLAWLQRRDEVLRAAQDIVKTEGERERLNRQREAVRSDLLRAAGTLALDGTDSLDLPSLRAIVRLGLETAQRHWQQAEQLRQDRGKTLRELESCHRALAKEQQEETLWRSAWAADMPAIGLPSTAGPPEAKAALDIWNKIEQEWVDRRQSLGRRDGIDRDLAKHQAEIRAFVTQLGDAVPETDNPLDLPKRLYARWKEAQDLADRRSRLQTQLAETAAALSKAEDRLAAATTRLAALRAAHGLNAEADPLAEAARADQRRLLAERREEARRDLAATGGGEAEETLRAAVQDLPADDLAAEARAIEDEETALQLRRDEAARQHLLCQQALEAMRHRDGIGAAAQQARDAQQTAARHTARWVRLWAAQTILGTALERFRDANEHPLVRRASSLLSMIAAGADNPITRLIVDYDHRDLPELVGLRADGSRCPVEGMSDGTRDQLYLALRIAAIEAAAAETEPLPFIADDLFITSDDLRTLPGLKALAALGEHTQVLLFTHHRTVVEAAQAIERENPGSIRLHALQTPRK